MEIFDSFSGKTYPFSAAEEPQEERRRPEPMNVVYGSPSLFEEMREAVTEDVYGGPAFFCPEEEEAEPPLSEMGFVYGGPEYFEGRVTAVSSIDDLPSLSRPENMPMMCVYAGPEYFEQHAFARDGDFAASSSAAENDPAAEREPASGNVLCSCCGYEVKKGSKFCPECGAVVANE